MTTPNNTDRWNAEYYKNNSSNQYLTGMAVLNSIQFKGEETVLDVGCGDGRLTAEIAKRVPNGKVLGIDLSANMIQEAQKTFGNIPNLSFECIDVTKFDAKNKFDLSVSFSTFHWIEKQLDALKSIYIALKPGGQLFIKMTASGKNQISDVMESAKWRNVLQTSKSHFQAQSPETIRLMLEQCGFVNIDAQTTKNERVYKNQKELCDWLMAWAPNATGLTGNEVQEFVQDVALAAKNNNGEFVCDGYLLHVKATKP